MFPQLLQTDVASSIIPLILTQAELKLLLRLRMLHGEQMVVIQVCEGAPTRLTVLPKTEVLA